MADGFDGMVDAAQAFFGQLQTNNEKAWFEPRKDHYTDDIQKPAKLFADLMAEDLARLTGQGMTPKVFRIYRDVRFSKDKTPYKTNLFIMWSAPDPAAPAWVFAIRPQEMWMGLGLLGLKGEMLDRYRRFIDSHGESFAHELKTLEQTQTTRISGYGPEPLKRVPKPYAADHPQAELLKRKGLALIADLPEDWRDQGLTKTMRQMADAHLPLWSLMAEKI